MNRPSVPKTMSWKSAVFILVAAISAIPLYAAFAALTCANLTNFAGTGSTAKACKDAYTTNGGVYWAGRMRSYMYPAVSIDRIGWYWWTDQQWCGSELYAQFDYGGSVGYGTDNWASTSPSQKNYLCVLTNTAKVNGKHDFVEGSSTWSPTWTKSLSLPTHVDP